MAFIVVSLQTWSERSLLGRPAILEAFIPYIPSRIHSGLFTTAAQTLLNTKQPRCVRESINLLVVSWPNEVMCVRDLLPQSHVLLSAGGEAPLSQLLLESLLRLLPCCKMRVADFSGVYVPGLFQLPLLALPKEIATPEIVMKEIRAKCCDFMPVDSGDNLDCFLPWRLQEMQARRLYCTFETKDRPPLEVHADCQLNLTDWVSMMIDEMTALILQHHTPYRMIIRKLTIEGYRIQDTPYLRWLLSLLDPEKCQGLVFYGKRQGIERVLWELQDLLPRYKNLQQLTLGTSGPRLPFLAADTHVPSAEQLLVCSGRVLGSWANLSEIYFMGMSLRHQLKGMLEDLQQPLSKLCLHSCGLCHEDLEALVDSKHCSPCLEELGLQYNKLSGMAGEICEIIMRSGLNKLDLRESMLNYEEKVHILSALGLAEHLTALYMYENEDMLTILEYQHIVELACAVPNLEKFYVFPFNFKPFEVLIRKKLEPACEEILSLNGRTDLLLQY